jgi:hypothetical protein
MRVEKHICVEYVASANVFNAMPYQHGFQIRGAVLATEQFYIQRVECMVHVLNLELQSVNVLLGIGGTVLTSWRQRTFHWLCRDSYMHARCHFGKQRLTFILSFFHIQYTWH